MKMVYSSAFGDSAKISTNSSSSPITLPLYLKNLFSTSMTSDSACTGFEPQNYLRDRCKKCFRLRSKHETSTPPTTPLFKKLSSEETHGSVASTSSAQQPAVISSNILLGPTATTTIITTSESHSNNNNLDLAEPNGPTAPTIAKKEKRRSWRDKNFNINDEGADFEDTADSISLSSYKTANSKGGMSSGKSMESVSSNLDCRSMVTAMSGMSDSLDLNANDEDRAITPTEAAEFFEHDVSQLRMENARLQEQINRLKDERQRWTQLKSSIKNKEERDLVEVMEERLAESQRQLQAYKDEITALKYRAASDSLCEKLTVENEALKCDIQDLQQELEEMQDQYREEEIDEFRELQRELELNAKNCRILQFKLRKSERQRDQLQTEKNHIASKLISLQSGTEASAVNSNGSVDCSLTETMKNNALKATKDLRIRELESELRVAKEVSVRLHNELEVAEDKGRSLGNSLTFK
uniref:Uncharacterized protein n=1 Tax=Ditylenchus dipsaci TaxID=166011 RepID=A0A915EHD9_9BILA